MTFADAIRINTRLQLGESVPTDERVALAQYLVDRLDAGDADARELVAMLFMAEHIRPEIDRLWYHGVHPRSLACSA
jgi:hypothetical protein